MFAGLVELHHIFWSFSLPDKHDELTNWEKLGVIVFAHCVSHLCFWLTWWVSAAQKRNPRWHFFNGPRSAPPRKIAASLLLSAAADGTGGPLHTLETYESPASPVRSPVKVFPYCDKVDWCTRTASFVHSVVVLWVITRAFLHDYFWTSEQAAMYRVDRFGPGAMESIQEGMSGTNSSGSRVLSIDIKSLQWSLCYTVGYFTQDLIYTLLGRMKFWHLFVVHHLAGLLPVCWSLFVAECRRYTFVSSLYFYVEVTTFTLDFVYWIETLKLNQAESYGAATCASLSSSTSFSSSESSSFFNWQFWQRIHSASVHGTFWLWVVSRAMLPVYVCFFGGHFTRNIADPSPTVWECNVPCLSGGYGILVFCYIIFCAGVLPAYVQRLRGVQPNDNGNETGRPHRRPRKAVRE